MRSVITIHLLLLLTVSTIFYMIGKEQMRERLQHVAEEGR